MKGYKAILAIAGLALVISTCAFAQTTLSVSTAVGQGADLNINGVGANADKNFGASGSSYVEWVSGTYNQIGLYKFDLSSIKSQFDATYGVGGWAVTDAQFNGFSYATWTIAGNISAYLGPKNDWVESTLTYNIANNNGYLPSFDASSLLSTVAIDTTKGKGYNWDLSLANASLVNEINTGDLVTVVLSGQYTPTVSDPHGATTITTKENTFSDPIPVFTVTAAAVPEPSSFAGMIVAFSGIVGFAARKRRA